MRRLLVSGLSVLVMAAAAAPGALAQERPPKLEPLPEPPPPPAMPADEPQVRIPVQEGDKVEEVRDGGRVIALKVTPPNGKPYFLVDVSGTGNWMRRNSLEEVLSVPMWPIKTFD